MKNIVELSRNDRDVLASSWALKLNRPKAAYFIILDKVKNNEKGIEELPFFIIEHLNELGYQTPLTKV